MKSTVKLIDRQIFWQQIVKMCDQTTKVTHTHLQAVCKVNLRTCKISQVWSINISDEVNSESFRSYYLHF